MSAFVTEKAHIDALLTTALKGPGGETGRQWHRWAGGTLSWSVKDASQTFGYSIRRLELGNADEIGEMLTNAMVASVTYRYPDDENELPGPINAWYMLPYRYQQGQRLTIVQAIKAIQCYEYQSCEHPGWRTSEAKEFCSALMSRLIVDLPGYEDAAWDISDAGLVAAVH